MKTVPRKPVYAVRVRRSAAGLGLFAEEDIPRRRFVVEYWGRLISDAKAQEIGGRYLYELENGWTIEGSTRKNLARYSNHSCAPNCEVEIRGNRVLLYALRKIRAGEELTHDYGKEYFEEFIKPHSCRCVKHAKPKRRARARKETTPA